MQALATFAEVDHQLPLPACHAVEGGAIGALPRLDEVDAAVEPLVRGPLERGMGEIHAALIRIEARQEQFSSELVGLRRELKEDDIPAIKAQLASLETGLAAKPSTSDFLSLATKLNDTVFKAFGLCLALLATGAGALAWLHRQGVF